MSPIGEWPHIESQFEIMRWNSFNFAIAKERVFSLGEVPFIKENQA